LARAVELHAKAEGDISKALALEAKGRVGDAGFTATGELGLGTGQPFHVDADLTNVDGAAFAGGPTSDVSGHVHAEGAITSEGPAGTFRVTTKESAIS